MTTIVTDGNFLIADVRMISTVTNAEGDHVLRSDNTNKITLLDNIQIDGKTIRAVAICGCADIGNILVNILRWHSVHKKQIELCDILLPLRYTRIVTDDRTATLVFVTENNEVHDLVASEEYTFDNRFTRFTMSGYLEDTVVGFGSGGSAWVHLRDRISVQTSAIDAFTICAHTDHYSSDAYTAYSVAENKLVYVIPAQADVEERVRRVQKTLVFYNPGDKPSAAALPVRPRYF